MPAPKRTKIPPMPDIVDPAILKQGLLIPPAVMKQIEQKLAAGVLTPGRISKKQLQAAGINSKYSVIAVNKNQVYGVLPGEKQGMLLGRGSFGAVKLAQDKDGKFWALKNQKLTESSKASIEDEYQKLEQLGQAAGRVDFQSASKNQQTAAVIMELAQGVQGNQIPRLNATQYAILCADACGALQGLHDKGMLHLDVKPENMIVDPVSGTPKLIDFGTSQKMDAAGKASAVICGSPLFMAPELMNAFVDSYYKKLPANKIEYSPAVDVASLGYSLARITGLEDRRPLLVDGVQKGNLAGVAQPGSEAFEKNTTIPDKDLRAKLSSLLVAMTADKPETRPSLVEAQRAFNDIAAKLNAQSQNEIKVALVNINEFRKLSMHERAKFVENLKRFDRVQLLSATNTVDLMQIEIIRKILDNALIRVRDEVIHANGKIEDVAVSAQVILQADKIKGTATLVTQQVLSQSQQDILNINGIGMKKVDPIPVQKGIKTTAIQFVPKQIQRADLNSNGKLLSEKNISRVRYALETGKLKAEGPVRITKAELKKLGIPSKFNIYVTPNADKSFTLMAAYRGNEHALGKGAYGKAKIVQDLGSGEFHAVKIQNQPTMREKTKRTLLAQEKKNLQTAGQLIAGFTYKAVVREGVARKPDREVMIMKMAQGQPLSKIPVGTLSAIEYAKLMVDVAKELASLHKDKNLIHADIKPENILRSHDSVKIIDYGTCVTVDPVTKEVKWNAFATQNYLPPELIAPGSGIFSEKTDAYSFAISMAEIAGLVKDGKVSERTQLVVVSERDPQFIENKAIRDPEIRSEFLRILSELTRDNPADRPTMSAAIQSLEALQLRISVAPDALQKSALVDLKEFLNADTKKRDELMGMLKKYDDIKVVYTGDEIPVIEAQRIMDVFSDAGMKVSGNVAYGDASAARLADTVMTQDSSGFMRNYSFVTAAQMSPENKSEFARLHVQLEQTKTASLAAERIKTLSSSKQILSGLGVNPVTPKVISEVKLSDNRKVIEKNSAANLARVGMHAKKVNMDEVDNINQVDKHKPKRPRIR